MRGVLAAVLLGPLLAWGQDFESYDDARDSGEEAYRDYDPTPPPEAADRVDPFRLARVDDPHAGFAFEALVGLLLADSAAAGGPQGRFSGGLRGTWEFGRAIALDPFREALLLDLSWWASGAREGTEAVFSREALHLFTVAPAWNFRLSPQAPWSFYLQAGAGLAWQLADVTASGLTTEVSGVRPVLQYGLGLRARPQIDERLSLTFRLELTRFRRGYLDDTWIGVSGGLAF